MKISYYSILAVILIVAALAFAGCSATKSAQAVAPASSGSSGSSSSAPTAAAGTAAAAAAPATCPTQSSGKGLWDGKWDTWVNADPCYDGRQKFYPATQDNPTPWEGVAGDMQPQGTFTQTGCAVTGSFIMGEEGVLEAPHGCPVSFTGTASGTELKGTWKAYCNIELVGKNDNENIDSGTFDLWMDPTTNGFAGSFIGNSPNIATYISDNCPNANSGWVGKRV